MLLSVKNLRKSFGVIKALDGVSFGIEEGEAVGLIGPNAAGKTTLFNIISGILRPDGGDIIFGGASIISLKPEDICRRGIGRTFQITRVFGEFTALENVMLSCLFGRKQRLSRKEALEKAADLLDFVGLGERRRMLGSELILTQQRALELAMALATEPSLLLLDEVAAGLSPKAADRAIHLMDGLREKGLTILVIDHVLRPLMTVADKVIVLAGGWKIAEGTPQEIAEDENVVEAYLGEKFVF